MIPNGLAKEAWLINNPALGSYLIWTFVLESYNNTKLPVHPSKIFCLFPFIYYSNTRDILSSTHLSSNLYSYTAKFSTTKACATDITLSIHSRVDNQKEKTLESLITAFDNGLLTIDTYSGLIIPNTRIKPIARTELHDSIKELYDGSRKLGKWLSNMNTEDVTRTIKVVF